ncbi:multidrug efflux SMR transporter [Halobacillus sp. Marseille-Q1614]|uniref:DMT family transporter n=1 Tax=Halobacillus sp. Marseille-Q1614 TaxID=2709134 RepID=UPI00156F4BB2|nr:multidrug efflux SMR transporter [Halobacillus sp. Marseille-Q1614]
MNNEWQKLVAASIFEVGWVAGLKHADTGLQWGGTIIAIIISFYLLIQSGKYLPVGTAYAVFTGLGTAGTITIEVLLFNEAFKLSKIGIILILLAGVIGLKLLTPSKGSEEGEVI